VRSKAFPFGSVRLVPFQLKHCYRVGRAVCSLCVLRSCWHLSVRRGDPWGIPVGFGAGFLLSLLDDFTPKIPYNSGGFEFCPSQQEHLLPVSVGWAGKGPSADEGDTTKTQSVAASDAGSAKTRVGSEEDTKQTPVHGGPEKNQKWTSPAPGSGTRSDTWGPPPCWQQCLQAPSLAARWRSAKRGQWPEQTSSDGFWAMGSDLAAGGASRERRFPSSCFSVNLPGGKGGPFLWSVCSAVSAEASVLVPKPGSVRWWRMRRVAEAPQPIGALTPAVEAVLGRGAALRAFHRVSAACSARVPSCQSSTRSCQLFTATAEGQHCGGPAQGTGGLLFPTPVHRSAEGAALPQSSGPCRGPSKLLISLCTYFGASEHQHFF